MRIYLKKIALILLFLSVSLNVLTVQAREDEDADVWVQSIDALDLINNRLVVGDLEIRLTPNVKIFDSKGKQLSRSALERGLLVSTTPEYRDNKVYVSTIIVME